MIDKLFSKVVGVVIIFPRKDFVVLDKCILAFTYFVIHHANFKIGHHHEAGRAVGIERAREGIANIKINKRLAIAPHIHREHADVVPRLTLCG